MDKREQAKKLLVHYFQKSNQDERYLWSWDNRSEIEHIVDLIIDAAKEELIAQWNIFCKEAEKIVENIEE